jgi:hypothetical protein
LLLISYSTSRGTSLLKHNLTESLKPLALQKLTRYFNEKVRATGSDRLISTFCWGLSTLVCWRRVMEPFPMSPLQVNLTPSFVHSMETVSVGQHLSSLLDMFRVDGRPTRL